MTWVTKVLKEVLAANGQRFFASKGEDRDRVVDDVVRLLKETNETIPDKVCQLDSVVSF
jgi:hypothetical protein